MAPTVPDMRLLAALMAVLSLVAAGCDQRWFGPTPGPAPFQDTWFDGDSITAGWWPGSPPVTTAYPGHLGGWNAALPGSMIEHLTVRVPAEVAAHGRPRRHFVMIGTNDILAQRENVLKMVADVLAFERGLGYRPTYLTLLPLPGAAAPVRAQFNDWLRRERTVVDCGDIFGPSLPASVSPDGVHLGAAGQRLLADCVAAAAPLTSTGW